VPDLSRLVVAIDPAVTTGEEADETGLICPEAWIARTIGRTLAAN
jgi:phage terminase large subunit-like protein